MRHRDLVQAARFSPDGSRLVTASADGTVRLWDATTTLPLTEPLHHGAVVTDARFSPDGRKVVTAAADGRVRIWPLPPTPTPAPDWLPEIADFLAGVPALGETADCRVFKARLRSIRAAIASPQPTNPFVRWLDWFTQERLQERSGP